MSLECACVHYNDGRCKKFTDDKYTAWCNAEGLCEDREPSHADRIRTMSDEELAEGLAEWQDWGGGLDKERWLEWLKQPAEKG